tara:strand:- start:799 stop:1149 length:351 start_codon:yes stop_codon:yes gene_type:complete
MRKIKIYIFQPYSKVGGADLFCPTSLYKWFGNVLIEAEMFKLPIISLNCKSEQKKNLKNGKYKILVKINNVKKLTQLIIKNFNNINNKKISRMYKSLRRFEIKNQILKYERISQKI